MEKNQLIQHYLTNYKSKIFMTKLSIQENDAYLMYVYEYEKEFDNFAKTFLHYLPFYVGNDDYFDSINEEDIELQLVKSSKYYRKRSTIIPHRTIETNGIYGELFLDFYLRIVRNRKLILTYASKRTFKSNDETKGFDNIVYFIDKNVINMCLCETKFVSGASNAKSKLIEDIKGIDDKRGHVSKEFINDYIQFVVEKGNEIDSNDKDKFKTFINDVNHELMNGNTDLISLLNKHNICVNFVFFAIFDSIKKEPEKLSDYYYEIYNQCACEVNKIGINMYRVEIVFIPTDNKPIEIKRKIEDEYA